MIDEERKEEKINWRWQLSAGMKPLSLFAHSFLWGPMPVNSFISFTSSPIRKSELREEMRVEWAAAVVDCFIHQTSLIDFVTFGSFQHQQPYCYNTFYSALREIKRKINLLNEMKEIHFYLIEREGSQTNQSSFLLALAGERKEKIDLLAAYRGLPPLALHSINTTTSASFPSFKDKFHLSLKK